MNKMTITTFNERFATDDDCLTEIWNNRYADLHYCADCGSTETNFYKVSGRKCYACKDCGSQIHPLADTIFHKSSTPLKVWFYAIFLFSKSKNGVSGKELERQLGVTYKTAWRMAKQIRTLFDVENDKLDGEVEMDETYVGGKTSMDKKNDVR